MNQCAWRAIVVLSLLSVLVLAAFLNFDQTRGLDVFRILIISIFTMLPAIMYYVFIASKKSSLFQEFVTNLYRLGLLTPDSTLGAVKADEEQRQQYFNRMRILSYVDQFESIYGPVGSKRKRELLRVTQSESHSPEDSLDSETPQGRILSPATGIPVFIATFLIGLGWIQFIPPIGSETLPEASPNASFHASLLYNELPALFAFLGAYFFSVQMLFRRYVTNDLRSNAFISVSIRIILGVIGAWLLQVIFSIGEYSSETQWLLFTSFVIGSFPPVIWRIIREISRRVMVLGNFVPSLDSDLPLSELDGLTIWHQTRFEEEDVENAHNMANVDIVSLLVNTKMPPDRIIAWIDQAILYSCVSSGEQRVEGEFKKMKRILAGAGIRTASALDETQKQLEIANDPNSSLQEMFQQINVDALLIGVRNMSNLVLINNWRNGTFNSPTADDSVVSMSTINNDTF